MIIVIDKFRQVRRRATRTIFFLCVCPLVGAAKSIEEEEEKEEERYVNSVCRRAKLARGVYCNYTLLSLLSGKYIEMYIVIIIFYGLRNHNK